MDFVDLGIRFRGKVLIEYVLPWNVYRSKYQNLRSRVRWSLLCLILSHANSTETKSVIVIEHCKGI
jgi:hypothetical protein